MKSNRGSTLAISLVILTSVTLAAVYAMQQSATQLKMIANMEHQHTINGYAQSCSEGGFKHLRSNIARLGDATRSNQESSPGQPLLDSDGQPVKKAISVYLSESDAISTPEFLNMTCNFISKGNKNGEGIALANGSSVGQSKDYFFEIEASVSQNTGNMSDKRVLGFFYRAHTGS